MNNNLVSIIMPAFRAEKTISDSIESVLAQTYQNFELIVIDDCSPDNTRDIVNQFATSDNRVKLISKDINEGVAAARNTGLDYAVGDFVAFLDSDDLWCEDKLQKQVKLLNESPNVDVTYTEYFRFIDKNFSQKVSIPKGYTDYRFLLKGDFIANSSALYRFKKFRDIRQKKIGAEDYLFWLEIFDHENVKGLGINEPLMYYRVADKQESLSSNKVKSASWVWSIYYKHLNLGFFYSVYYFINYVFRAVSKRF
ncbi:glycosyltransferase family 2 protein [Acinetobacter indicus]|uniref:glycosyltransferase family 2 protein n=1 Tax=Acinetobacter indicus TaxID=756892 RepID=UPI001443D927|nr:glycosyltransferase family 2 protein [Acinetobacter indicus]